MLVIIWVKKNPKFDTNFITNFAGNIGTPAMIFYTVTTTGISLSIFTNYFVYALIMIGGFRCNRAYFSFFNEKRLKYGIATFNFA